jgi:hypothetical protein
VVRGLQMIMATSACRRVREAASLIRHGEEPLWGGEEEVGGISVISKGAGN